MNQQNYKIKPASHTKKQVGRNYDRLSQWYDLLEGGWEKKSRQAGLKLLSAHPVESVLEIGFGTGSCLVDLANAVGKNGLICGIDISTGMAKTTSERLFKANLLRDVHLVCGDACILPFDSQQFDAIFMGFTLELFEEIDLPTVLAECKRILKSGGRICVVALSRAAGSLSANRFYEFFHYLWPQIIDCRPIYPGLLLEKAGFSVHTSQKTSLWGLGVEITLGFPIK
jgi:ubiquinone/menaquinone biosynthesis C-methylase UbiE